MKNKRMILGILGAISLFIGLVLFISTAIAIQENNWYTWKPPYTQFEADIIQIRIMSITSLVVGAMLEFICILSRVYESKITQSINTPSSTRSKCPNCGLNVDNTLTICPGCQNELKKK